MKIIRLEELQQLPQIKTFTPEQEAEALRLARAAFTAEDLQKFTELDEGVPMEEFLAELEQHRCEFEPQRGGV